MELKKIKLNKLSDDTLAQRQLQALKGGRKIPCKCACAYEGRGGSSYLDNGAANQKGNRYSPQGGDTFLPGVEVYPK